MIELPVSRRPQGLAHVPMKELLTPKQVGRAIDVSESSVKRWCDRGEIATQYTAGGHRRIALATVLDLVRQGKYTLVNPAALGLPASSGQTERAVDRARQRFTDALVAGDEMTCRQLVLDLYLANHSLAVICDEVLAAAFVAIGDRWSCGEVEVYRERRGCEIASHVVHELRDLLPSIPDSAPLAMGGTATGDHYELATSMAEVVLRDCGWHAVCLGENLPFSTLDAALAENRPQLFWLSCSYIPDIDAFLEGYNKLYAAYHQRTAFVVGGNALDAEVRRKMNYAAHCDNMQHLATFAQTLRDARECS